MDEQSPAGVECCVFIPPFLHSTLGAEAGTLKTTFLRYTSEKAMAPHSSTLAWKVPWMEEPGRLQSMLRFGHD